MEFGNDSKNGNDTLKHGRCYFAKLTPEIVREIRLTNGKDGLTQEQRSKKYKISLTCLRDIQKHRTWKHVTVDE